MPKLVITLLITGGIIGVAALTLAQQNLGAPDMVLSGGQTGEVPFPHHRHQLKLRQCKPCHDLFPQSPGAIKALQNQGKLKRKQVMNSQCVSCHRQNEKAGQKTGPVTCKSCHVR